MTGTGRRNALDHVAVFHDGPEELATLVAPDMLDGLAGGARILACLDEPASQSMADALGARAGDVTFVSADDRYSRPATAMAVLKAFMDDALGAGAPEIWSLGAIGFADGADERWFRYEASVNEVLEDVPLRAVCSYDTSRLSEDIIRAACRSHPVVLDVSHGRRPSPDFERDAWREVSPHVPRPLGPPAVELIVHSPAHARAAVEAAYRDGLGGGWFGDLQLLTSELVTNALRHGRPPVKLSTWHEGGAVVIQVVDHGEGFRHAFPELRPPGSGTGGYGMWLTGQIADDVRFARADGRTVVTATIHR